MPDRFEIQLVDSEASNLASPNERERASRIMQTVSKLLTPTARRLASPASSRRYANAPVASTSATPLSDLEATSSSSFSTAMEGNESGAVPDAALLAAKATVDARRRRRAIAEHMERFGSSQNRHSTFQAHHVLTRAPPASELTLSHLVAAQAHLGHHRSLAHPSALPYIYGTRAKVSIIDLRTTLTHLKRAAQVISGTVENDGIIVFLSTLDGTERAIRLAAERCGPNGFATNRWLAGSLTNAGSVYAKQAHAFREPTKEGEEGEDAGSRAINPFAYKPSLLVLMAPREQQNALREATLAHVPTIGITDTDVDPRCVTYSIPANDDSPRTIQLIAGILGEAGRTGLERRLAKQRASAPVWLRPTGGSPAQEVLSA
ncbi:uncharacterized protein L969DRAFT_565007 [Mixia osmundae IAM 14324]|uniref:Ribosomal protein S2 n=1 Tax=Mixia osmundae (strain CBS 9802 / IAM 14324 / JCM 22182 / KY 12970) TaxID=764103 RepID=G7DWP4_MIXOS|nr:uncharacterized protein L969DRAFT_565007 [Mixia osmundae IAM 14324]KEI38038.1 hypothetical protein L969DRAFT_565007 [Mixia osmundae IAM 14324]GAA95156.1 hypothetical protein E5Q_01811 [Mixia osmundae IAM 14324]